MNLTLKHFSTFLVFIVIQFSFSQSKSDFLIQKSNEHIRNMDSLKYYSKLLIEEAKHNKDLLSLSKGYNNLGRVMSREENFIESNKLLHKALVILKSLDNKQAIYGTYKNLSNNHRNTKYFDSAYYYQYKIKHYEEESKQKAPLYRTYMSIGIIHLQNNKLDSALYYADKASIGFQSINDQRFLAQNIKIQGDIYYTKKEHDKAITYADSSLHISQQINFQPNIKSCYILLARSHQALGNISESENFFSKSETIKSNVPEGAIRRTINTQNSVQKISQDKERSNRLLNEKKFYQSNLFIASITILLLAIIIWFIVKQLKASKIDITVLQEQLELYKAAKEKETNEQHTKHVIQLKSKAVINAKDILYIKSDSHYLEFYLTTSKKPEIDRNTLINIMSILPESNFMRIHKSHIINLNHLKIINSTKVMLTDGTWLNLSRTYKPKLHEILNKN